MSLCICCDYTTAVLSRFFLPAVFHFTKCYCQEPPKTYATPGSNALLLVYQSSHPYSFHFFPPTGWYNIWPTMHNHDAHTSMTTDQLPDRVHPTGSETKYHVFNNQITDNVDIYHSEATTLKPKACTMKYTKNIRAQTLTTHIQSQNPEIIYEYLPYCSYQPYSFKCDKYISLVT